MFLVSTLEKGSAQNIFPVSTAGKTLKEKIFFVSTYIDKYKIVFSFCQFFKSKYIKNTKQILSKKQINH